MSPTKMLGTDGTKALAPSTVQQLSARTSSGTPLHWGQVPTSLLHVLAVKSHPTPEYAWEDVELALGSSKRGRAPEPGVRCGQPSAHQLHGDALAIAVGVVEDVAGQQLDGLHPARGVDCRPPMARWSKITFVPTASVKRTSRDTGCAGTDHLHLHPKYPVAQV